MTQSERSEPDTGTRPVHFTRTDAVLVRQPIAPGEEGAVRDLIDEQRATASPGVGWLLAGDDVVTASVFLEADGEQADALVWYVELLEDGWAEPVETLRRRSPLFGAGLETHLASEAHEALEPLIHAHNPARPATAAESDVVLVSAPVRRGPGRWLARFLAGALGQFEGTRIGTRFEHSVADVVEAERMWTETLWLERTDQGSLVHWYMEAEDMDHVMAEYEENESRVARWSETVLTCLFGQSVQSLGDPASASDELLAHGTTQELR